jgi:hypothetical protein
MLAAALVKRGRYAAHASNAIVADGAYGKYQYISYEPCQMANVTATVSSTIGPAMIVTGSRDNAINSRDPVVSSKPNHGVVKGVIRILCVWPTSAATLAAGRRLCAGDSNTCCTLSPMSDVWLAPTGASLRNLGICSIATTANIAAARYPAARRPPPPEGQERGPRQEWSDGSNGGRVALDRNPAAYRHSHGEDQPPVIDQDERKTQLGKRHCDWWVPDRGAEHGVVHRGTGDQGDRGGDHQ